MTVQEPVGGGASETTEPAAGSSAATDVSLRSYIALNWRWQARFDHERDRRYKEGNILRAEALNIKERADEKALALDREIRAYKDEKANEFRGSLDDLSKNMATRREVEAAVEKLEATIQPLVTYVTAQQGGPRAVTSGMLVSLLAATAIIAGLYFGFRGLDTTPVAPAQTVTVTVPAK